MRRLVLVLGLAVLGWLGRRELRSAADAQRYLTLLALLQVVAVTGRTASSAKAQAVERRLNEVVLPALGAVGPIGAAGNAAFLATLNSQPSPSGFGGPASSSGTDLFNWANNATARMNQVYTLMQSTGLWA
ncbi:MAG TPA: hypothetical protein VK586_10395 [Streptosporangiaceae bacterium]|nr:hypothetical protein [Streptosporangiaceae bacterium]